MLRLAMVGACLLVSLLGAAALDGWYQRGTQATRLFLDDVALGMSREELRDLLHRRLFDPISIPPGMVDHEVVLVRGMRSEAARLSFEFEDDTLTNVLLTTPDSTIRLNEARDVVSHAATLPTLNTLTILDTTFLFLVLIGFSHACRSIYDKSSQHNLVAQPVLRLVLLASIFLIVILFSVSRIPAFVIAML